MAKDLDKTGRRFETGMPCTYKGGKYLVVGGHEDGVSLADADGHRTTLHAGAQGGFSPTLDEKGVPQPPFEDVEITGDAPDADGLAELHETWVKQAEANRLALAKK